MAWMWCLAPRCLERPLPIHPSSRAAGEDLPAGNSRSKSIPVHVGQKQGPQITGQRQCWCMLVYVGGHEKVLEQNPGD